MEAFRGIGSIDFGRAGDLPSVSAVQVVYGELNEPINAARR
jgi:hypothetical protein